MRQRVLSIENKHVSSLIAQQAFHFDEGIVGDIKERIRSFGKFVDREWAEGHSSVKQIVACGIVMNHEKVLCLRRSKNSNRLELRLNWTLMIGGHVDEDDMDSADPILSCVIREIKEETGLEPRSTPRLLGYVTDPATPVGRLHMGAVYKFESIQSRIQFSNKLDNYEFVNAKEKSDIEFRDPSFVADLANNGRLDPWSEIFVQYWERESSDLAPRFPGLQLNFSFLQRARSLD